MTENDWLGPLGLDLGAAAVSLALVLIYELVMRLKARRDPAYTVQSVNAIARTAWVEGIMTGAGKDVLAVQTLRNSIMGPTFLASTAVLLMMGTLTLTAQGDKLSSTWHALNVGGATTEALFTTKVLLLLLVFFIAFFAFSLAIRLFIHVGFMINVPRDLAHGAITPASVAHHLNRAGRYHTIGMRAYYYSVPLVFWLFGPHLMVVATLVLIAALYRIDRAPSGESEG